MSPTRALVREIGWWGALRTAWGVLGAADPFAGLAGAAEPREIASRRQARPAIHLYRALRGRYGQERALAIARAVIAAGGQTHLQRTLGRLDVAAYGALGADARRARVGSWLDRFFTAQGEVERADPAEVAFTIRACALVRLTRAAGHPELAPAFCAGDAAYFLAQRPAIALERPSTLAEGGASCLFRLGLTSPRS